MKKKTTAYSELSPAELDEIAAPFDREFVPTRPLTKAMREADSRARRGRPQIGLGAEKIRVSVERGLLRQTDTFAKRHRVTRSAVIAKGLRAVLRGAA